MVSVTLVQLPGTVFRLNYMISLTLRRSKMAKNLSISFVMLISDSCTVLLDIVQRGALQTLYSTWTWWDIPVVGVRNGILPNTSCTFHLLESSGTWFTVKMTVRLICVLVCFCCLNDVHVNMSLYRQLSPHKCITYSIDLRLICSD